MMINVYIFSAVSIIYIAVSILVITKWKFAYNGYAVLAFLLLSLPLLLFDQLAGLLGLGHKGSAPLELMTLGLRNAVEEICRLAALVFLINKFHVKFSKIFALKSANVVALFENATSLFPLYYVSIILFFTSEVSINFADSIPIVGAFDPKNTYPWTIILLSLTQLTRLVVHTLLGYVGLVNWQRKNWAGVFIVVLIHLVHNIPTAWIWYQDFTLNVRIALIFSGHLLAIAALLYLAFQIRAKRWEPSVSAP